MKIILSNLAATAALATTAVLLVADGGRRCDHDAQEITYEVSENTCGEPGLLRVRTLKADCNLDVEVDERTGLPSTGDTSFDRVVLAEGTWHLAEYDVIFAMNRDGTLEPREDEQPIHLRVNRHCEPTQGDGVLRLTCTARETAPPQQEVHTCEAVLTPR
ncbi:hypothetical protein [Comamonas sp. JC664]|uniref:hypothetical protein n=1 Tax=Comamonas sp. JC664 TaxID=2801917 RepID=UPI00174A5C14|nr:hypothetical protein [Comamonas sp. JC664]MBL0699184.1 hypothetical protein [Comamonas sp. JC664]GHH01902.1 hypothetical protein GCM10012319_69950 [Comamonas sp. KCTC 72670]